MQVPVMWVLVEEYRGCLFVLPPPTSTLQRQLASRFEFSTMYLIYGVGAGQVRQRATVSMGTVGSGLPQ